MAVKRTLPDDKARAALQGRFAHDAGTLIVRPHVVPAKSQTNATANDYRRTE